MPSGKQHQYKAKKAAPKPFKSGRHITSYGKESDGPTRSELAKAATYKLTVEEIREAESVGLRFCVKCRTWRNRYKPNSCKCPKPELLLVLKR